MYITIQEEFNLKGEDGTIRPFLPSEQFEYSDKQMQTVVCTECQDYHYKIEINNEIFWVPQGFVVLMDELLPDNQQDHNKTMRDYHKAKGDYRELYAKIGVSYNDMYTPDFRDGSIKVNKNPGAK